METYNFKKLSRIWQLDKDVERFWRNYEDFDGEFEDLREMREMKNIWDNKEKLTNELKRWEEIIEIKRNICKNEEYERF